MSLVPDRRPGPDDAVSRLFDEAAGMVHRTAWRITGRPEDAEDVLQSVFLHLVRSPPMPWPDRPAAYIHRAAVNASLDLLRRRRRTSEVPIDDAVASPRGDQEDALSIIHEQGLAHRLRNALPLLSPLEVEVFSLRCFEDRSNAEIAEMLGKSANHVGVTLHAARKKLRDALGVAPALDSHSGSPSAIRPAPEGGLRP